MADEDELFYLQPGFDLNSLTVPRLRSILVSQNILYPSSAKKTQLLEIIDNELLPQRAKLLRAQARVRRTSKGITDVPSSQEGTIDGDHDDDRQLMPPPPAPKTPRSRKSKSDLAAESVARTPSTSRRTKTPTRRSVPRTPRASDTEHTEPEEVKSTVRRSRKSAPSQASLEPAVKIEEPDARLKRESLELGTSPFSDDNPFQSAPSPPSASDRRKSASRSRKSLTSSTTKRRQTKSPSDSPPSRSTVSFPVSRITSAEAEDGVVTTEEFTPDAAQELAEEERNGQLVPGRSSTLVRRKKKKQSGPVAKSAPLVILTTVLGTIGAWYRQEKVNVGYCGVGEPNWSLASNEHIPSWVHENFQPACEPCPQHAVCYTNMDVECESDFVLKPHPLGLSGAFPLPPTCEPDGEKQKRIKLVADRAIEELRQRRASYECGEDVTTTNSAEQVTGAATAVATSATSKLEMSVEELKEVVSKMRRKSMNNEEFEDLWRGALEEVRERDEVEITTDRSGRQLLSSSSLARLPFTCAIRRSLLRAVSDNLVAISILILGVAGSAYGRSQIITYRQNTARIPALVGTTLDRLATQAALSQDGRVTEAFISIGQLRDDVLRSLFSASERERVWYSIRKIIEGNSNVRTAIREGGKTGEFSRVWEWIGPVDLAPGLEGRRSGGMLTDGRAGEDGASPGNDSLVRGEDRSKIEVRRWDEGRAIY